MWYLWPYLLPLPYGVALLGVALYGRRSAEHARRAVRIVVAMALAAGLSLCVGQLWVIGEAYHAFATDAPVTDDGFGHRPSPFPAGTGALVGSTLPILAALQRRARRDLRGPRAPR